MRRVVAVKMPSFAQERDCQQLIHDFYEKYGDSSKPFSRDVIRINAQAETQANQLRINNEELRIQGASAGNQTVQSSNLNVQSSEDDYPAPPEMPKKLPKLVELLVSQTPDIYKPAVAHAIFPPLATHLCRTFFNYIDNMEAFGKGQVYVNGHALGRFWQIGPQQTLYLPGCWLKKGKNEVIVLDVVGPKGEAGKPGSTVAPTAFCQDHPELDKLNLEKSNKHNEPGHRMDLNSETPVLKGEFKGICNPRLFIFRNIDDFAILQLVSNAYLLSLVTRFIALVFRRSIAIDLLSILGNDFHILLARVLHHREVILAEHFRHIIARNECHHQGKGKHHRHIEEVAHYAHRIIILAIMRKPISASLSHKLFIFSFYL